LDHGERVGRTVQVSVDGVYVGITE